VTVVSSDLSGSAALAERLDPESLSQVLARYYEALGDLANRVEDVLREAAAEAGDDPVDPELLLTLTQVVAAAFDPYYGGGH
jgi:class 3 adenylate cyclase